MTQYDAICDDFYVNMNLGTEMELPSNRDTVLHFFEQVQKKYPQMRNFYSRDKHDFVLEEDKDGGQYRWCSIESRRISSGHVNPASIDGAIAQHQSIHELVPYGLSVSPLDCEALDILYGFDFTFRGNHNQLVAEALGLSPALERLIELPGSQAINYEPSITLALDEDCRMQCRVSIETRTNAYQIRTGDYPEDQISVYVSARSYGSLDHGTTYVTALAQLNRVCEELLESHVVDNLLRPLARTIATK